MPNNNTDMGADSGLAGLLDVLMCAMRAVPRIRKDIELEKAVKETLRLFTEEIKK